MGGFLAEDEPVVDVRFAILALDGVTQQWNFCMTVSYRLILLLINLRVDGFS